MKRIIAAFAALVLLPVCAAVLAQNPAPDYESVARTITADLAARRYDQVVARFGPAVAKALDAPKLATSWEGVIARYGAFRSIERVEQEEKSGYRIVYVTCSFEKDRLALILVFDSDQRVVQFTSAPPGARESWKPPAYAKMELFTERPITVTTGEWQLPGTLTVPSGPGPFPAVVLVHGSGPNNQDETIGPNKMFKDLAWGLASRGVAVLRYEKRTHKYRARSSADPAALTMKEETIDDARSAVALLASNDGIDSKRILVAGHSLGAFAGPRIAEGDSQVSGLILLAGNTRPAEELVIEQVRHLVSLSGPISPEGQKQIEAAEKTAKDWRDPNLKPGMTVNMLGVSLPAAYVLDMRSYNPAVTAARLKIPILVMQGERDYQVRVADFEGWRKALVNHKDAAFKLYPSLNHLFMPGAGPSSDAEYLKPNHVFEQVIDDIADWIRTGTRK